MYVIVSSKIVISSPWGGHMEVVLVFGNPQHCPGLQIGISPYYSITYCCHPLLRILMFWHAFH